MIFTKTKLKDAYIIDLEQHGDERGFFARAWCKDEFAEHGITTMPVQANMGQSQKKGTIRGMHYQVAPHLESKFIRCIRGAVFDIMVDVRPESPTYKQWLGVELTAENRTALYVPEGFAHGYLALEDDSEVFYLVSGFYEPSAERGFRWDDPAFGIELPIDVTVISEKDQAWPDFDG